MSAAIKALPQRLQLAIVQYQAGRLAEAETICRDILKFSPNHSEVLYLLGLIAYDSKAYDVAFGYVNKAHTIHPSNPFYLNLLGSILVEQGEVDDAVSFHRKAVKLKADFAEAYNNLGTDYKKLNKLQEAAECFQKAITIKPNYAKAYYHLGLVFHLKCDFKSAINCFQKVLSLNKDHVESINCLGASLQESGQTNDAESCFRKALTLQPDYAEAYNNLGKLLLHDSRNLEEAESCFRKALLLKPDYIEAYDELLMLLNYCADGISPLNLSEAQSFGSVAARSRTHVYEQWQCAKFPKKLRIGLVSGDFFNHPVGCFLEGLLANIDLSRFELFAYTNRDKHDELTSRIKPFFAKWREIFNLSDEASAKLIHADGIHLLIDLSGHTQKNRLPVFSYKPAPVQVTWLGYVATTGVAEIDYLLADPYVVPPCDESHFTERIWRLPETYLCFTPHKEEFEVSALPALTNGYITFGCFNNIIKINDAVIALWAQILTAIPNAKIFFNLRADQLKKTQVVEKILARFAAHGITRDRLILEGTTTRKDYFHAYHRVDIALDPFPYPGVTVSAEGLWMGVPVLTKRGDYFLPHNGETVAHNTGQAAWIAHDDDDYVNKAIAFSSDLVGLARLRHDLRGQVLASPLFNAPRFTRHFEEALWAMWNTWEQNESLRH